MKNFKAILAVSLFVIGLGFTSCSDDDRYIQPERPEHLPDYSSPDTPIHRPDIQPL